MLLRRGTSRTLSKQGLSSERGPGHERGNKRGRLRRWGVPPTPALRRASPGKAGSTERVSQPQRPRLSTAKGRTPAPASGGVRPSSELRFPGAPPQPASRAAAPAAAQALPSLIRRGAVPRVKTTKPLLTGSSRLRGPGVKRNQGRGPQSRRPRVPRTDEPHVVFPVAVLNSVSMYL